MFWLTQPVLVTADSGSVTLQVRLTLLLYHWLAPSGLAGLSVLGDDRRRGVGRSWSVDNQSDLLGDISVPLAIGATCDGHGTCATVGVVFVVLTVKRDV